MGSIVLDGAVIGDESFVAAGVARDAADDDPAPQLRHGAARQGGARSDGGGPRVDREAATLYAGYAGDFMAGCKRID